VGAGTQEVRLQEEFDLNSREQFGAGNHQLLTNHAEPSSSIGARRMKIYSDKVGPASDS